MNKAQFFKYCDRCEEPKQLQIVSQRIYRELEDAVFLYGVWHNCSITHYQLYQPFPGRQFHFLSKIKPALNQASEKYQRWLEEWRSKRPMS
mgnify:CR=1